MREDGYRPRFADPEEYAYVGPFMASIRVKLGITQAQLSEATGFSVQSISRFENGKTNPTTVMAAYVVDYLLGIYGMDITEVMDAFDQFIEYDSKNSGPIVDS